MKLFPREHTAPLFDVDIFWHYHILDTMKYAADCEQIFGYFLHHFPYSGLRVEDDEAVHHQAGARMQELYETTFGEAYIRQEAVTAQSQPAQANTAWCVPTTANPASLQMAQAKTAWCVPTTVNPASLQPAPAKTAWCVPATVNRTLSQPAAAKTSWCVPTTEETAWLQGATAITAQPQAVAPNERLYSRPVLARAA
jgi:hypothetical protein